MIFFRLFMSLFLAFLFSCSGQVGEVEKKLTKDQIIRKSIEGSWSAACQNNGVTDSISYGMVNSYGDEYNQGVLLYKSFDGVDCLSANYDYAHSYTYGIITTGSVKGETDSNDEPQTFYGQGLKMNVKVTSIKLIVVDPTSVRTLAQCASFIGPDPVLCVAGEYDITGKPGMLSANQWLYQTASFSSNKQVLYSTESAVDNPNLRIKLDQESDAVHVLYKQ